MEKNQSNMEKVHRGITADVINLQFRNLKKGSNTLARNKRKRREETCSCEQTTVDHIHEQKTHNYNKWKYKKRKDDNMDNQKKKGRAKHLL
eukprot:4644697-Heterocapsa_arctica.AAC.1